MPVALAGPRAHRLLLDGVPNRVAVDRAEREQDAFGRVVRGAVTGDLVVDTEAVPPAEVESAWTRDGRGTRLVLVP